VKVERAAFLSLTAGLFAAACASSKQQPPSDTVTIPPQPPPPPRVAPIVSAEPPPPPRVEDAGSAEESTERRPPPTALAPCGAEGPPPEPCTKVTLPGPTCEQGIDLLRECERMRSLLRSDVAQSVVACMHEKHASCTYFAFGESACAKRALGESACVAPDAEAACRQVFDRCTTRKRRTTDPRNTVDVEVCRAAWSAVRPLSRPRFVACMLESCVPEACFHVEAKDPAPPAGPRRPPSPSAKIAWKGPPDPVPPPWKTCKLASDCVLSEECCQVTLTNWAGAEDARQILLAQAKKGPCNRSCGIRVPQVPDCVAGQCTVK
jgi:hypothetical protein